MRKLSSPVLFVLVLALALGALPVVAQQTGSTRTSAAPSGTSERLFLSFIEDATIADRQWWEGRLEVLDGDDVDATLLRGVVALQPWTDVEVGGRMGFGNTDTDRGLPDGSGGTDLELWGKYLIGTDSRGTNYSVGGVMTVPTGDDTAGLGLDAFGVSVFGAARYVAKTVTVGGHIGVQFNDDGQTLGSDDIDGETSAELGGMIVAPITPELNLIGELVYKSERLDGLDDDTRVLGGVNWHVFKRGTVRGALAFGLSDGAPDGQLILGYAAEF